MVFNDDYDLTGFNNQDLEGDSSCKNLSWEYMPLEEVEPCYKEKEPFKVVLGQTLTKLDSHLFITDLHLLSQESSIQNHEFYEDQISSMVMDSHVDSKEYFEGCLEEFPFKEKIQESLELEETYETIDLSSSIELSYTLIINSYVSSQHSSSSCILYERESKKKFLYQYHHSKLSLVDFTFQKFSYLVKPKHFHNQDPYVVMYDIYYGRNPLFDKHFSNS